MSDADYRMIRNSNNVWIWSIIQFGKIFARIWQFSILIRPTSRDVLWYGAGVCLSVCPSVHKTCKHDTDWTVPARIFKLGTLTTYDKKTNPIDFQGQGSKVKVTRNTLLFNLVNTIQTELFKLGPSNLVHILLMARGRHLLISEVRGQRSRSYAIHCC